MFRVSRDAGLQVPPQMLCIHTTHKVFSLLHTSFFLFLVEGITLLASFEEGPCREIAEIASVEALECEEKNKESLDCFLENFFSKHAHMAYRTRDEIWVLFIFVCVIGRCQRMYRRESWFVETKGLEFNF